jgi:hypothetical protein
MEDKWRIKKIGDDWMFIPEDIRKKKREYENLTIRIKRREKKIESELVKIGKLKKELREMKVLRTKGHNQMVKYHKKLTPSFTISFSKTKKFNRYLNSDSVKTRGNHSWTIIPNIGGKRKWIYLGSNTEVTMYLDLMDGKDDLDYYYEMYPHERTPHLNKITQRINEIICPLIVSDMKKWLKKNETLDGWFEQDFKKDYLMNKLKRRYKNSEFYEVHQSDPELMKKLKSGFTVIQPNEKTGSNLYVEKKKWTYLQWEEYYRVKGNKELEKKFRDKRLKSKKKT